MKSIGIITNFNKDAGLKYTKELILWLEERGVRALVPMRIAEAVCCGTACENLTELYEKADFAVILGGDGTILRNARQMAEYDLPILGVNFGTLGYLADVERADAKNAISSVIEGNYTLENRMMLSVSHYRGDIPMGNYTALNEVYISHTRSVNIVDLEMSVNDAFINVFRADGIMVSTPTGSTAYNLSAGGPILMPDTRLMAVTSVCPHNLYSRPFVISGDDCVTIKVLDDDELIFSLDGAERIALEQCDTVKITGSEKSVRTIKTSGRSFYDTLRYKLMEGRR